MKKCVIIGSGLGGLACGVILSRNGYEVTVLEQGLQPGGCLQCFSRRGVRFETGMHFIGSADEGQVLRRLLNYLGVLDKVELSRLSTTSYDIVSLDGDRFEFANGREPFIENLAKHFPGERDSLNRYFDLVQEIASASSLHTLRNADSDARPLNTEYQLRSVDDVMSQVVNDATLRNVLVGNMPLYAGERGRTPFSTHAFIADFYNQSSFRIVGGSDRVAQALVAEIESRGGQVLCRQKVTRVVCDATHATGVETDRYYPADLVIADIHPARLVELCDTPLLRKAYRSRVANLPETVGCFTIYVKFRSETVPYMNSNFYSYHQREPWDCEIYDDDNWPRGYLYMHCCNERNQRWATGAEILSYMRWSDVERWSGTKVGRRGDDYREFKRRHAERLLAAVERDFPGLTADIEYYETSTPLTYLDYIGTEHGAMYGIAKDVTLGPASRVHHRTRIPNLLLTGQNINSHGILGVLVGTIVTCSELLTSEFLFNEIIKAER